MRFVPAIPIALFALPLAAQVQWTQLAPTTSPSSRCLVKAVDAGPLGVILFGGELSYTGSSYVADTWGWSNGNWTVIPTTNAPSRRGGGAMCHDPLRNRIVYFGGWTGGSYPTDTWEFDGTNWFNMTPSPAGPTPPRRDWAGVAYDPVSQKVVMFGGHDFTLPAPHGDTWSWDGIAWTQLAPSNSPSPRLGHVMTYCESWGFPVLHGGVSQPAPSPAPAVYNTDLWIWVGNDWALASPTTPVPGRAFAAAAWDSFRERLVIAGGLDDVAVLNDVWEYGIAGWYQRQPSGGGPAVQNAAAFFDDEHNEVVVFGGATGNVNRWPVTNATWSLGPTTAAIGQPFGNACGNAPSLDSSRLAWLGGNYRTDCTGATANSLVFFLVGLSRTMAAGTPLPLSLASYGMPGCDLLVDPLANAVIGTDPAGEATNQFAIPLAPALLGTWIYSQVAMPSPGANAAGMVVSSAVEHRLGGL